MQGAPRTIRVKIYKIFNYRISIGANDLVFEGSVVSFDLGDQFPIMLNFLMPFFPL